MINTFKEGDKIATTLLVFSSNRLLTGNGIPYFSGVLQDKTGRIDAKKWDADEQCLATFAAGQVVLVKADVIRHKNTLQLRISEYQPIDQSSINLEDFCQSSPQGTDTMLARLQNHLDAVNDPQLRLLAKTLLEEHQKELVNACAGIKLHHAYRGGLLQHILAMIDLAVAIKKVYPFLDDDYLIVGAFIHDLGKLEELGNNVTPAYTLRGKLIGHISLFHARLVAIGKSLAIDEDKMTLLEHLLLTHHGKLEYGSPIKPQIPEAFVLQAIDLMDASLNAIEMALNETKSGEFTTRLAQVDDTNFFKKN